MALRRFAITITSRLYKRFTSRSRNDLPARISIAPMGVDTELFRRKECYLPWRGAGPLRLFSCGRLNFVKGHQDLINAISLLKQLGVKVRLEIAGEDETGGRGYRVELEQLISDLQLADSVVLLGAVPEQRVLQGLLGAHLFVLASHCREPLGVAIMEAMSNRDPGYLHAGRGCTRTYRTWRGRLSCSAKGPQLFGTSDSAYGQQCGPSETILGSRATKNHPALQLRGERKKT